MTMQLTDRTGLPVDDGAKLERARRDGLKSAVEAGYRNSEAATIANVISELVEDISQHVQQDHLPPEGDQGS